MADLLELEHAVRTMRKDIHAMEQTLELFTNELVDAVAKLNAVTNILISGSIITEDEVESLVDEQKTLLLMDLMEG